MVPDMTNSPMQLTGSSHAWKPAQRTGTPKPRLDRHRSQSHHLLSPQSTSWMCKDPAPAFLLPPSGLFRSELAANSDTQLQSLRS